MSTVKNFLDQSSRSYRIETIDAPDNLVLNFEQKLINDIFSLYFSPQDIAQRFEVPYDYLLFIRGISFLSRDLSDGSPWFWVTGAQHSYTDTIYEYERFAEDKKWHKLDQPPLMLLAIGGWSDKHTFFLSCDKAHHWGKVYDCHDDYIYNLSKHDISYESFMDLLIIGA